jgi:hypothetical protein
MHSTFRTLRRMATVINNDGLHRGENLAHHGATDRFDICALAYIVAEDRPAPAEFFTDEPAAMDLIENSVPAMDAIRAISAAIDNYLVPDSDGQPDPIEHVAQWACTPPIGYTTPPTNSEVIGCILRAAETSLVA